MSRQFRTASGIGTAGLVGLRFLLDSGCKLPYSRARLLAGYSGYSPCAQWAHSDQATRLGLGPFERMCLRSQVYMPMKPVVTAGGTAQSSGTGGHALAEAPQLARCEEVR
jgi:hypothetical protein